MNATMGQIVPSCQGRNVPSARANVSPDLEPPMWEYRRMIEWLDEAEFNDRLCERIQRLRVERGWVQEQMATAIGVPLERYKKYETRSPMPAYLIPRFAQQVDREPGFILTGRSEAPARRGPQRLTRTGTDD